jgi:hypothetical protein
MVVQQISIVHSLLITVVIPSAKSWSRLRPLTASFPASNLTCFCYVSSPLCLCTIRLRTPNRHELPHNKILLLKPFLPSPQRLQLLAIQVFQRIKRPIQILRQHVLIETATRQSPAPIAPSEVRIWSAWPVEVAAGGDVEDAAAHGEVDGHVVEAVVREERGGCKGAEHGWRRRARERLWGGWAQAHVDEDGEEGEEDEVYGREDGGA